MPLQQSFCLPAQLYSTRNQTSQTSRQCAAAAAAAAAGLLVCTSSSGVVLARRTLRQSASCAWCVVAAWLGRCMQRPLKHSAGGQDAAPAVLLVPCGHLVMCAACAALVMSSTPALCPLCREGVGSTVTVCC